MPPIVTVSYSPPTDQPSQLNDGKEWTDEDYAKNIRWIVAQGYNQNIISPALQGNKDNKIDYSFNYQYLRAASYVYGQQNTTGYGWANKDALNNNTQLPMWRGMDMFSLLTFFTGKCRERFSPLPKIIQAGGVVGEVLNKKMLKFNVLKRVTDNETFIKQQEEINGIQLIPDEYLNIHKGQDSQQFFTSFVDDLERAYRNIAKNFLYTNRFLEAFLKAAQYVFIGGRSVIHCYENKGRVYMRVIPPEHQIIDMFKSQEQHQDDQFVGSFEPFSLSECLALDDFTSDEAKDLERISKGAGNTQNAYNIGWRNCSWYGLAYTTPQIWRANVQWKSIVYVDGVPCECIRQGRLYGNKYLKGASIKEFSISTKYDKSRKMMDFSVFTPMTFFGSNQGICMIVQSILDMKNALITQMHGMYARALGKVPFIDRSLLDGVTTPEMLAQAKQTGIIEGNRAETEGEGKTNNLIENLDLTVSESVQLYQLEIARLERELGNILNMPRESIQGERGYVNKQQLQSNQATSQTGTEWLYGGLQDHFIDVIDRATELQILVSAQKKEDLSVQVGDTAAELISMETVQELLENTFKIGYDADNTLTIEAKTGLASLYLQSASIDPDADLKYLKALKAQTIDEMEAASKQYKKDREEREDAIAKQKAANALANTQATMQGQRDIAATGAAAGLEKQEMSDDTKLAQDIIAQSQEQPI
jgi:hypothetical protein